MGDLTEEKRSHYDLFFISNKQKNEENIMINPENIERIEITTRWVSVVAAAILVGIQFTRLVQTQNEESSVDKSEK